MTAPIFVRCVRCDVSFSFYQKRNHACPERAE